ncbi:hypothetical protein K458DRAFT_427146 [Lentithecium fluviatile CBS 122367]|uniref:Glucose receptor Git3-like N-terminal domain-containing protein n=1 Tax=Lentithecium fluviatile CBS 122367 TaxID=1168545 RepID=A0A6G1JIV7_9PLEO|nr:hypothetical protein K458DRAFT_427146 [Lentithecium fluviatile CBS 122367]
MLSTRKSSLRDSNLSYIFTSSSRSCGFFFLLFTTSLLSQAASALLPNVSTAILRTFNVRVAAATCASVSMIYSFVAFYWFARMRKHFRHRLIMLLIYGDCLRSSFLFLCSIVSIARGTVKTESAFCQSGGFIVQYGTETSDYAVLVITVHNTPQVFHPSTQLRAYGLYPYRYFVYVGGVITPGTMAALAFINPHWGYMSLVHSARFPSAPFGTAPH